MHELIDRLASYAAYHRNPNNIRTHFVGIPLIALGAAALLFKAGFAPMGLPLNLATVTGIILLAYYAKLDRQYCIAMVTPLVLILIAAGYIASLPTLPWLVISLITLVIGWTQQLIGHKHEGRKPAFLDDIRSIPIGPLFLLAEFGFKLGWRTDVKEQIEARFTTARY